MTEETQVSEVATPVEETPEVAPETPVEAPVEAPVAPVEEVLEGEAVPAESAE